MLSLAMVACRDDVIDSAPDRLQGTTWKFDDFYITFVSETALNLHGENGQDVLAKGTYSVIDTFIEVALNDRVRAGSWDGEQLMIDGMVGRLTKTAQQ